MQIPVQNIYYLLCYAWDQLEEGEVVDVEGIESPELADLFARVLIRGTNHLLRRGLDRGYLPHSEDTSRLRGRIDFDVSLKRTLLSRAQAHCHYDELSYDVLHNRILKSTLRRLALTRGLDSEHRKQLLQLHRRFRGVSEVHVSRLVFHRVQLYSNNAFYRFLMNVCELVQSSLLVSQDTGAYRFKDFLQDESKMWRLFERFVYNFYRHEQDTFVVYSQQTFTWDMREVDPVDTRLLPSMRTDTLLHSPQRSVIIDTKYYRETTQSNYGSESFHSSHLYQMFAYLKNAEQKGGSYERAEGILLYPTVRQELDHSFKIQGHWLRIKTINLVQDWQYIHTDLLQLIA